MALDSTGLRKVRRGVRVLMGPALWDVVKVTTSGQAWLRVIPDDGSSLIVRDCRACTVHDARHAKLEPAGPAEVPLIEEHPE